MAGLFCYPDLEMVADSVSGMFGPSTGFGCGYFCSDQVQFASVQKLPRNFLSRFQANGCRQGKRKINIELWCLAFGTNGLHF